MLFQKIKIVFHRVTNIVKKGENVVYQHFLLFRYTSQNRWALGHVRLYFVTLSKELQILCIAFKLSFHIYFKVVVCIFHLEEQKICNVKTMYAKNAMLNPFPNKPWFSHVCWKSLLKTLWEKKKLLVTSNFFFSQCFLPILRTFCNFHQTYNCCLQTLSIWKSLEFNVWERVKPNTER